MGCFERGGDGDCGYAGGVQSFGDEVRLRVGRDLMLSHPPTYYLPPDSIKLPLSATSKSSFCEVSDDVVQAPSLTTISGKAEHDTLPFSPLHRAHKSGIESGRTLSRPPSSSPSRIILASMRHQGPIRTVTGSALWMMSKLACRRETFMVDG